MKYHLVCTSYNVLEDGSLQLRNNWIEPALDYNDLMNKLVNWNVDTNSFKYPSKRSVSNVIVGEMSIGCPIHIRIVRF